MSALLYRGYGIKQTAAFIKAHFDAKTSQRLHDSFPEDLKTDLRDMAPGAWYPREYEAALLRAIASVKNDDAGSYADLVACGEYVANEATNTFLRLLLKILTPAMFAKKVPEFWDRDNQGSGRFEVETSNAGAGKISMKLLGAEGFDHIGIASIGWIRYGLVTMGKSNVKVTQTGWSMASPSPQEVTYDVAWE